MCAPGPWGANSVCARRAQFHMRKWVAAFYCKYHCFRCICYPKNWPKMR